jgi:hypothetical protein
MAEAMIARERLLGHGVVMDHGKVGLEVLHVLQLVLSKLAVRDMLYNLSIVT